MPPTDTVDKAIIKANKNIEATNEYSNFFYDVKQYLKKKGYKIKRVKVEDFDGDM